MIHARTGKSNMIVITLEGVEIHRCEVTLFVSDSVKLRGKP
jgi:hypothetical protein